jgi:predicted transcriptional regulator
MADAADPRHAELVAWLTSRGHSRDEIAKILTQVSAYDAQTVKESIFDSIGGFTDDQIAEFLEVAMEHQVHRPEELPPR